MLSRATPAPSSVPFADPIAMNLLADSDGSGEGLGVMNAPQLGFTIPLIGVDTDDVGDAFDLLGSARSWFGGGSGGDSLEAITDSLPPSAIGAYEGNDGWWYDNVTNQKLSHEEASKRQHQVMAAYIGATVGADGYWYINGRKLSHTEAYNLYLQKSSGVSSTSTPAMPAVPMPGTGGTNTGIVPFNPVPQPTGTSWWPGTSFPPTSPGQLPTNPQPNHPAISPSVPLAGAPLLGGLSPTMLLGVGAAALVVVMLAGRKRA